MYPMIDSRLRRHDGRGIRFYYKLNTNGDIQWLPSVTSIIKETSKTPEHLIKWIAEHGQRRANELRDRAANYGTVMHLLIDKFLTEQTLDLAGVKSICDEWCRENYVRYNTEEWAEELAKDLAAFANFCADYEVEPLSMESMLCNDTFAGAVDLICSMTIEEKGYFGEVYVSGANKGMPKETKRKKRITAIVDFKSGRHGFYPDHRIQLFMYKQLVDEWFLRVGERKVIEGVFNWSPKDWRTEPGYNLKQWTDDGTVNEEIDLICKLFFLRNPEKPSDKIVVDGTLTLGEPANANVTLRSIDTIVADSFGYEVVE